MRMGEKVTVLAGNDLHKNFTVGDSVVRALSGVDISLTSGEMVMLLGPSGSGKTTLLYVLSGLEAPDKGTVTVEDKNIYALRDSELSRLRSREFGFVFQSFNLIGALTALENVEIPLRVTGKPQAKKRALEMLERVGLAHRAHHKPGEMSGGEQQRVSIARALVAEPKIVFADEPTGNLDSDTGAEIMSLLSTLVTDNNAACLIVTHNPELTELADQVYYLRDGRIVNSVSKT
jgi:putative ABC transport system ATP-binding protein